jgi:hypothetical protein
MPIKPLDLPMEVAKAFVKNMRAYHAKPNAIKRDEIAGRQMHALRHAIDGFGDHDCGASLRPPI